MSKAPVKTRVAKAVSKATTQEASDFQIKEGVAGIQAKPTMYLGELGPQMAYRCVKEEVDNALDEALAGRNKWIEVYYDYDESITIVADKAGGIPVEMKTRENGDKISILTAAFTITHAGGKFEDSAYKVSTGTHGVGVTAVNGVSEWLEVWSRRKGKIYHQRFENGRPVKPNPVVVASLPKNVAALLTSKDYGTVVMNKLNQSIVSEDAVKGKLPKNFRPANPEYKQLGNWLKSISDLNPSLNIVLTAKKGTKSKTVSFLNKLSHTEFLKQHVADILGEEEDAKFKPFILQTDYVTALLQWTTLPHMQLRSSANNSPTASGGTHVRGLIDALVEAVKPYENSKHLDKKKRKYASEDLLFGLVGFFDWRMHGASFDSQVKDKLVSKVQNEVKEAVLPELVKHFAANKALPKYILDRAVQVETGRLAMSKSLSAMADAKRATKGGALPQCLDAASTKDNSIRELFLVEGDSAGGTAKNARNPVTQEVFKASGKPANALNATLDKVIGNPVVGNFLISLGVDFKAFDAQVKARVPNPTFPVDKLRVQRIYFLADADVDGYHINSLFLAIIWTLLPDLLYQGRVYVVDAPLYNVMHKGKHYGGNTKQDLLQNAPSTVKPTDVQRAKGWGEVSPEIMEAIAFDPKIRRVIRIKPFVKQESLAWYNRVLGDDASARRQLLGLSS